MWKIRNLVRVSEWHIQEGLWKFLWSRKGRLTQKALFPIPLSHCFPWTLNWSRQHFSLMHFLHTKNGLCMYEFWRQWLLLNYWAGLSNNILTSLEFHILGLLLVLSFVIFFIRLPWQQRENVIFLQNLPVCYPDERMVCLWLVTVTTLMKHLPQGHV